MGTKNCSLALFIQIQRRNQHAFQSNGTRVDPFEQYQMSRTKVAYTILHGIAPIFLADLVNRVKSLPFYSTLFDESMNDDLQTNQMDIQIRYFNKETLESVTQYIDSKFLARCNAQMIF